MTDQGPHPRKFKLFIGGLAHGTTKETLKEYFGSFGTVKEATVIYDSESGRSRRFGFVTFESSDAVNKALAAGSHSLQGKTLKVESSVNASSNTSNDAQKTAVTGDKRNNRPPASTTYRGGRSGPNNSSDSFALNPYQTSTTLSNPVVNSHLPVYRVEHRDMGDASRTNNRSFDRLFETISCSSVPLVSPVSYNSPHAASDGVLGSYDHRESYEWDSRRNQHANDGPRNEMARKRSASPKGTRPAARRKESDSHHRGCFPISRDPNFKTDKIFVGGLPDLSDGELKEYFSQYGEVIEVLNMYDKKSNRPRGFGFITFSTTDAVDQVIKHYNAHCLKGKWVEVKKAEPKKDQPPISSSRNPSAESVPNRVGVISDTEGLQPLDSPTHKKRRTAELLEEDVPRSFPYAPWNEC
eukprot:GHVP01032844.1.p1 GENE.GHVP01032844.1~~GHVP01032844.1.p1  ORF type:complete len:411 (-),score=45.56 GHVP01032844.1:1072-2304(-)